MINKIKLTGIPKLNVELQQYMLQLNRKLPGALMRAGAELQRDAQEITPVEFGVLKNSARTLFAPTPEPNTRSVEVSFSTNYAIYVHERLDVFHPIGQAKFLETPARQNRSRYINTIKRFMMR